MGGLAAAPHAGPSGAGELSAGAVAAAVAACVVALAVARPRLREPATAVWLLLLALVAAGAGLAAGSHRVRAIDAGALEPREGARATAHGFVAAVPRRARGTVSVRLETASGRLLVEAHEPLPELPVGRELRASGTLRAPHGWQAAYLRRFGIAAVLEASRVRLTGRRRGGVAALVDRVRDRAEAALERGMPEREAALTRGFVLGQDDRIDPATIADFKRSGLQHLLAVSGQNVILLALLAVPLLALLGVPLRARLLCVLALIAVYVPVTGAGPSIQRAAVMGAAGIVAALAGQPRSRWYALLLAAFATLVVNPRAAGDVGWQLSFAAVVGILLWSAGMRRWLLRRLGPGEAAPGPSAQRALAEGAALTTAATLATAPVMAVQFESLSVTALPANLLAVPAVAPVMWLGMLVAIAGQVPAIPVEPLNAVNSLLVAYIAQVAHWMAAPNWALPGVALPVAGGLGTGAALLVAGWLLGAWGGRRRGLGAAAGRVRAGPGRRLAVACATGLAAGMLLLGAAPGDGGEASLGPGGSGSRPGLRITVLDVGQGDAILLRPPRGDPVLVDAGPPGAAVADRLDAEGVERLSALAITHDQSDHSGGAPWVLEQARVGSVAFAAAGRALRRQARAAEARPARVALGDTIRVAGLRLHVLWPPPSLLERRAERPLAGEVRTPAAPPPPGSPGPAAEKDRGVDPNALSLVLLARWRGFTILLTGDAEAEVAPVDPGPLDALKVAHHGSEDGGLERLLARSMPRLAAISVGGGNPYGHPAPPTLAALDQQGVQVLRTDLHGDIEINVARDGAWTAGPG